MKNVNQTKKFLKFIFPRIGSRKVIFLF